MELKDTCEMMNNADYKERFRAEYAQLAIRYSKLIAMLEKYRGGTLDFKPTCSYEVLFEQSVYMKRYLDMLDKRAEIESVNVNDLKCDIM